MADGLIFANPFEAMYQGELNKANLQLKQQAVEKGGMENTLLKQQMDLPAELAKLDMPASQYGMTPPAGPDAASERALVTGKPIPGVPDYASLDLQSAQKSARIAALYRSKGKYKEAEQYDNLANAALGRAATAQKEAFDQNTKRFDTMAAALNSVKGPQDIQPMLDLMARYQPGILENNQFQKDPITGQYLWDTPLVPGQPSNKDLVALMSRVNIDKKKQAEIDNNLSQITHRTKLEEQTRDRDAQTKKDEDRRAQLAREKFEWEKTHQDDNKDIKETDRFNKQVDIQQRRLDNDSVVKDFGKYQQGMAEAMQVYSVLQTKGYEGVTTANAQALAKSFYNMIEDYRGGRAGGKYQQEQIKSMDGVYQKLQKYVNTIGEGDKQIAAGTMAEVVNKMNDLFNAKNAQVVRRELDAFRVLQGRVENVKPTDLALKGDVRRAIASGDMNVVFVKGKRYAVFGNSPQDHYELPEGF